jgi:putative transcriptional regulator
MKERIWPVTRKKASSASLKKTSNQTKKISLGETILDGLKEYAAYKRGEIKLRARQILILDDVDVKAVREQSGLSQSQFASHYGFNPRTLQEWEQGRSQPDNALRAYLTVIARNPAAVQNALKGWTGSPICLSTL